MRGFSCTPGPPQATDLALRLTLLELLLRPVGSWGVRPAVLALAVVGLLHAPALRQPALWLALALLTALRVMLDWPMADNHAYLLSYWCLAVGLACLVSRHDEVLALNARLLIGLVFLFAFLWKLVWSADYLDGTFFRVTLLTDPRFEGFVRLLGGLDAEQLRATGERLDHHSDAVTTKDTDLALPSAFDRLVWVTTAWNLGINLALAAVFLLPFRRLSPVRHSLLLAYCVITYAVATVDGFGWLLLAMGAAMLEQRERRSRLAYVSVFLLIILYREIPWYDAVWAPLLS